MGFIDSSGFAREYGDGFVDASGCFRNWGEGFVDYDGVWRNFGEPFVDKSGFMRNFGDGFVDGDGIWREPRSSLRFCELIEGEPKEKSLNQNLDESYEPIIFSSITADNAMNGLSIIEKIFQYAMVLLGLNLMIIIEPFIFIILYIIKKLKKDNISKLLAFGIGLSGFITIGWFIVMCYLYFFQHGAVEQIFANICSFLGSLR